MSDAKQHGYPGDAVPRIEDPRLLRGLGAFLDDLPESRGALHLAFVRSPHAHARIRSIDASAARALRGVSAVLTGADMAPLARLLRPDMSLPGIQATTRSLVCEDRVRFVGDIAAVVLAESRNIAADAVELVAVDYEPLAVLTSAQQAMAPGAPLLHEGTASNVLFHAASKTAGFDAVFESAAHVFSEVFTSARMHVVSMEPRGCLAAFDPGSGTLTFWSSTQVPHLVRTVLAEHLDMADTQIRVIAPDVGGGFGMKAQIYPEEFIAATLSRHFGLPLKWVQDRYDDFLSSAHARDFRFELSLAVDPDGRLLAMKLDALVNLGAYPCYPFGASLEAGGGPRTIPGPYKFRQFAFETRAVATNTCPTGACRGVAAPISFFALEGMMDRIARGLGLDPAEVRRRNLVQKQDFPYVNVNGIRYDGGSYAECMERALELAGYDEFRAQQARPHPADGAYRGIGIAVVTEQTGQGGARYRARGLTRVPGYEAAVVRIEPSGKAIAFVSQATQGQGHLTSFAQIIAQELGLAFADVTVIEGDTGKVPFGSGTFASRGMVIGGGAVLRASVMVREKIQRLAAHRLEVHAADIVVEDGFAHVAGVPQMRIPIQELAKMAYSMTPHGIPEGESFGLEALDTYDPPHPAISNAAHVACVAVDRDTGVVTVERYVVVHDCGRVVNPLIVAGQTHGAVVQGIGEALWEEIRYDENGQLLTSTLMDYAIPIARDIPDILTEHMETPSIDTAGGFKGMAESGTIGAVPAIANAVGDALSSLNGSVNRIPLRPEYLLGLINGKKT